MFPPLSPPLRFGAILYRMLAEVSSEFSFNFPCAHNYSRQRSYKKLRKTPGKLTEFTEKLGNLCGGERIVAELGIFCKHNKTWFGSVHANF